MNTELIYWFEKFVVYGMVESFVAFLSVQK